MILLFLFCFWHNFFSHLYTFPLLLQLATRHFSYFSTSCSATFYWNLLLLLFFWCSILFIREPLLSSSSEDSLSLPDSLKYLPLGENFIDSTVCWEFLYACVRTRSHFKESFCKLCSLNRFWFIQNNSAWLKETCFKFILSKYRPGRFPRIAGNARNHGNNRKFH